MPRSHRRALLASPVLAVLAIVVAATADAQLTPGDHERTVLVGGFLSRVYDVHVPAGYDGSTPVPLILDFHGFGSNKNQQKAISGWNVLSETEGFIVLHPNGLFTSWNAGVCCGQALTSNVDDVGFARAMILATAAEANVDLRRVYATGLSNGGAMSHKLGCEATETFAAVAPLAFPIPFSPLTICQPSRAISVLHFAGIDDTLVPYGGGGLLDLVSAADSFAYWRDANGCGGGLPDETVVTGASMCETYTSCADGVEVGLCSIDASDGPPFPGHVLYWNDDLVLAEVAWDFLAPFQAPVAVCGDGLVGAGEACDDGNAVGADGCSATCQMEACYTCSSGEPSVCKAFGPCLKCQRTVIKESAKHAKARSKILAKCELAKRKGTHADACPDAGAVPGSPAEKAALKLAKAVSKLDAKIARKCGGANKTCSGRSDETSPAQLLWPAVCPNLEGGSCTNAIDHCGDVAECLGCIHEAAVAQAVALPFESLAPSTPGSALDGCQQTIGRETQKFLAAKSTTLRKCWDARVNGKHDGTCPDALAAPGSPARKAYEKIAKAESKKVAKICKACGGPDKQCDDPVTTPSGAIYGAGGGDDDVPVAAIGFPATCPAVTVPAGPPCAQTIATLADVVECVACVTEFKVDCMDRAQVPQFGALPAECNP